MKRSLVKAMIFLFLMTMGCSGIAFGQTRANLTVDAVASFQQNPTANQVVNAFTTQNQPLYWGLGFEVTHRHLGIGGTYTVDFVRTATGDWWLDWYGEAVHLSYHLFGRRVLLDPFVSVGLGSAGRVALGPFPTSTPSNPPLLLSIFPVLSGGLGLDLDGFYVSAKASYLPVISPPPATAFENVPLGHVQVVVAVGVALGR